jgi:hypothetical protein
VGFPLRSGAQAARCPYPFPLGLLSLRTPKALPQQLSPAALRLLCSAHIYLDQRFHAEHLMDYLSSIINFKPFAIVRIFLCISRIAVPAQK